MVKVDDDDDYNRNESLSFFTDKLITGTFSYFLIKKSDYLIKLCYLFYRSWFYIPFLRNLWIDSFAVSDARVFVSTQAKITKKVN